MDDDDLYSLRAIRLLTRSMRYWAGASGGEKDRLPEDEWRCGGVTLYYNYYYSAPSSPSPFQRANLIAHPSTHDI